jgi:DNA-binding IclR family transcriptional regulator
MLAVLDLFTEQSPAIAADEIISKLKYSRPTGYRYVRELVAAGLLVRSPGGYSLGPRIIELDWHIRTHDPVLMASRGTVKKLASQTGCGVTQMGMYGEHIVTIHYEPGPQPLEIGFDRGRPMPLWRGAPSKAIVAFLPRARLERLYRRQGGRGFARFYEEMQAIRKAGYAMSFGELDVGKVGIGAPVFRERSVAGSVCLVLTRAQYDASDEEFLVKKLLDSAAKISAPQVLNKASALPRPIWVRSSSEKPLRSATARSR